MEFRALEKLVGYFEAEALPRASSFRREIGIGRNGLPERKKRFALVTGREMKWAQRLFVLSSQKGNVAD